MNRIDASKLITSLLNSNFNPSVTLVVSDMPILEKIARESIEKNTNKKPKIFQDKNAIESMMTYLSAGSMFEEVLPCIVEIPEKITNKKWSEEKKLLKNIPTPFENCIYFFAPMALKSIFKSDDFPKNSNLFFSYEPSAQDLLLCIKNLCSRYMTLAKNGENFLNEITRLAVEYYSNDLYSCDAHFSRMENGKLSFHDALSGQPEINAFHLVDAIAQNNPYLLELRLSQCGDCGVEPSGILMALVYFLKQVISTLAALEKNNNLKQAFDSAHIPYPAQARIQLGLKHLNTEKIKLFFTKASTIEMNLRIQKNPHEYLAIELMQIFLK